MRVFDGVGAGRVDKTRRRGLTFGDAGCGLVVPDAAGLARAGSCGGGPGCGLDGLDGGTLAWVAGGGGGRKGLEPIDMLLVTDGGLGCGLGPAAEPDV